MAPVTESVGLEIGLIGVGKMGAGLLQRWQAAGHTVAAYDPSEAAQSVIEQAGGTYVKSVEALVQHLAEPRILWLMIPAGEPVKETVRLLSRQLSAGDVVIDGGNSHYKESRRNGEVLAKHGIRFVDVGVSGGVAGAERGYAMMAGGDRAVIESLMPVFTALQAPEAFAHVGPVSAGHYVKMVHNAIEYGIMQAMGEGFDLLKHGPYQDLDLAKIAHLWQHGTIIRSFLMDLAAQSLAKDGDLGGIAGYVNDSGEGRWAVEAAVEQAVPFWVNTAALYARFDSRQEEAFAAKLVAALRKEFGGHAVKKT